MNVCRIESELEECRDAVVGVYRGAYSQSPYFETEDKIAAFGESWNDRIRNSDFRLVLAQEDTTTLGMAYGWTSEPATRWHEKMTEQLGELADQWLESCFSFVDIAVMPTAQGRGVGKALYRALFADLPNKTALLYTHQSDTAAFQMYQKLGWIVLRDNLTLSSSKRFVLMGKELKE